MKRKIVLIFATLIGFSCIAQDTLNIESDSLYKLNILKYSYVLQNQISNLENIEYKKGDSLINLLKRITEEQLHLMKSRIKVEDDIIYMPFLDGWEYNPVIYEDTNYPKFYESIQGIKSYLTILINTKSEKRFYRVKGKMLRLINTLIPKVGAYADH